MTPRFAAFQEPKNNPTTANLPFDIYPTAQGGIGVVAHYHVSRINSSTMDRLCNMSQQELNVLPIHLASGHLLGPIRGSLQIQCPSECFRASMGSMVCLRAE